MAYQNTWNKGNERPVDPNTEWASKPIESLSLPEDFVDEAERVIRRISTMKPVISITKLRNLFSMASEISNIEKLRNAETLSQEGMAQATMMRIRMVYEAGREESVKTFLREAKILEYLKNAGHDREKIMNFAVYMEALVAYYRFLIGGKEK